MFIANLSSFIEGSTFRTLFIFRVVIANLNAETDGEIFINFSNNKLREIEHK